MAKCGMVLRHWGSRMLSDPIWKQVGSAASSCPTSSSAETNTETIKVCSCPRIRLLGQLYWTIFLFVRYLVCSLESCSADFVISLPPPICLLCSSIFSIPQRCLYFDNTFNFSDLEADGFSDNLSLLILKTTSLWALCLIPALAWLFSVWSLLTVQWSGFAGNALFVNVSC